MKIKLRMFPHLTWDGRETEETGYPMDKWVPCVFLGNRVCQHTKIKLHEPIHNEITRQARQLPWKLYGKAQEGIKI